MFSVTFLRPDIQGDSPSWSISLIRREVNPSGDNAILGMSEGRLLLRVDACGMKNVMGDDKTRMDSE